MVKEKSVHAPRPPMKMPPVICWRNYHLALEGLPSIACHQSFYGRDRPGMWKKRGKSETAATPERTTMNQITFQYKKVAYRCSHAAAPHVFIVDFDVCPPDHCSKCNAQLHRIPMQKLKSINSTTQSAKI